MHGLYDFLVNNELLKSNFLLTLVTLTVAVVALYIYSKQHRDEKANAAQAIYSEIAASEYKLASIREAFFASQVPILGSEKVLSSENWSRYKYLFVKDLKTEEWNVVEGFYNNCLAYDAAVELNNSYFHLDVKHVIESFNRYYYDVIHEFHASTNAGKDTLPKATQTSIDRFQRRFLSNHGAIDYRPQKPIDDARKALVALDTNVSLSAAGQKLKRLAKL